MFDNPHLYCNLKTYYLKEVKMNYETVEENIRNYRDNNDSKQNFIGLTKNVTFICNVDYITDIS